MLCLCASLILTSIPVIARRVVPPYLFHLFLVVSISQFHLLLNKCYSKHCISFTFIFLLSKSQLLMKM